MAAVARSDELQDETVDAVGGERADGASRLRQQDVRALPAGDGGLERVARARRRGHAARRRWRPLRPHCSARRLTRLPPYKLLEGYNLLQTVTEYYAYKVYEDGYGGPSVSRNHPNHCSLRHRCGSVDSGTPNGGFRVRGSVEMVETVALTRHPTPPTRPVRRLRRSPRRGGRRGRRRGTGRAWGRGARRSAPRGRRRR